MAFRSEPATTAHIPDSTPLVRGSANAFGLIVIGDALEALKALPTGIAQCCVTSPPYWGLRDYELAGQIGTENDLQDYLAKLSRIFAEVARILKPDGILWLNLGDSYTSGNRGWRAPDRKNRARAMTVRPPNPKGLKEKDLIGVPWRVAFALQKRGWFLRSDIIWHKPNGQPESVRDRPTLSHEYLFLLSMSKSYYYDQAAIREPTSDQTGEKNRRSVWSFNVRPGPGSRVTSFPAEMVRLCIQAGSRAGDIVIDPFFGGGTVGVACLSEDRSFIGVELNPLYAELAASRTSSNCVEVDLVKLDASLSPSNAAHLRKTKPKRRA